MTPVGGQPTETDAEFNHPVLAELSDELDRHRNDLLVYLDIARQHGAGLVLDVGSGTGVFAQLLSAHGIHCLGVDPARASVDMARSRPYFAIEPEFLVGDTSVLPEALTADLATMTANVAQAINRDEDWERTLEDIHAALRDGGRLVFESRVPADRAWERWTREHSHVSVDTLRHGRIESWFDLEEVRNLPDGTIEVTFSSPTVFLDRPDLGRLDSRSTLRFREADRLTADLGRAGFTEVTVEDLPYAPGRGYLVAAATSG